MPRANASAPNHPPRFAQAPVQYRGRGAKRAPDDRIDPGKAVKRHIYQPIRERLVDAGVYRPPNRWRQNTVHADKVQFRPPTNPAQNPLQRAVQLAERVPWNWKNYGPRS